MAPRKTPPRSPQGRSGHWSDAAIVAAFMRVGMQLEQRFRWLLDFAERDLRDDGKLNDTWAEVVTFFVTAAGQCTPQTAGEWERYWEEVDASLFVQHRPFLRLAQAQVKDALAILARERRLPLEFKVSEMRWLPDGTMVPLAGGGPEYRFYAAIGALLTVLGSRLAVCQNPQCQRLFIKTGKQAYCGSRCSQQVRTTHYRQTHPDRAREWQRAAYVRRQKRKHPRAKVARRPRRALTVREEA